MKVSLLSLHVSYSPPKFHFCPWAKIHNTFSEVILVQIREKNWKIHSEIFIQCQRNRKARSEVLIQGQKWNLRGEKETREWEEKILLIIGSYFFCYHFVILLFIFWQKRHTIQIKNSNLTHKTNFIKQMIWETRRIQLKSTWSCRWCINFIVGHAILYSQLDFLHT
jgi:hypothetical protein